MREIAGHSQSKYDKGMSRMVFAPYAFSSISLLSAMQYATMTLAVNSGLLLRLSSNLIWLFGERTQPQ